MIVEREIVLGPPGTGKTTTLIGEVEADLARGVHPERIGYLSFTRRAADEAVTRACLKFKREREEFPYFRTLHSLCFRFLGLTSADVMEGKRMQEFALFAGVKINGRRSEEGDLSGYEEGDRILFMENLARVRRVTLRQQYDSTTWGDDLPWSLVDRTARALREFKEERGIMDFTDMLLEFVRQGSRPQLDRLYIDEAQDLSRAQWEVVRVIARDCTRVMVAGDDDQGIYQWAGADLENFINLTGSVRVLDHSWRVPVRVQRVALRALAHVRNRRPKAWNPRDGEGVVDSARTFEHCDISGGDVLVLARNDYILREQVEPALRSRGVIFEKHGHPSVKTSTVDVITDWEKLRAGQRIAGADAKRVYASISVGVGVERGHKSLSHLQDEESVDMSYLQRNCGLRVDTIWHEALDRISLAERTYIMRSRQHGESLRKKPRVRLSTIHGSKGGQADHVILMREIASRSHREMEDDPQNEARVWYVGATRAKERLTLVDSQTHRECPWL